MSGENEVALGSNSIEEQREEVAAEAPPTTSNVQASLSDEEASEDGLALLPRHTKVLVTGNNRTKSVLVGLKGVVKKAVGLGGWHWLVLSDGTEVRLQRNALTVLEQPTGEESDSETEEETKPLDIPRSKRRQKLVIKHLEQEHTMKRTIHDRKRDSEGSSLHVNFNKLEAAALKRYRRHYKLQVTPNATKDQLVSAVGTHFMSQKVDERKIIHTFFESMMSKRQLN